MPRSSRGAACEENLRLYENLLHDKGYKTVADSEGGGSRASAQHRAARAAEGAH